MTRSLLLALLFPVALAHADAIKLKSGEVIEGRIVSSDSDSVLIEVQYSPTITEQRRVPRSELDVAMVATPDERDFKKIVDLKAPATAMTPKPYEDLLNQHLRPFLKKHPASDRTADVRQRVKDFEADIARLRKGEVKVNGTWYSADAYAAEKYQLEADAVLAAMRRDLQAQNYAGALNQFDLLRTTYNGSPAFAESLPLADTALKQFTQQLALARRNLAQVLAQRQAVIDRTPVEQRANIERALATELAQATATADRARAARQRFFPVVGFDEKGLKTLEGAVKQLGSELARIDREQLKTGVALVRQAQRELTAREYVAARTTFDQLKAAWPTYEGMSRLEKQVTEGEAAREAGLKVGEEKAKAAASPAP